MRCCKTQHPDRDGPGRVEIYLGLIIALLAFGMALAALSAAVSMCR